MQLSRTCAYDSFLANFLCYFYFFDIDTIKLVFVQFLFHALFNLIKSLVRILYAHFKITLKRETRQLNSIEME